MEGFLKMLSSLLGMHAEKISLALGSNDDDKLLGDDSLDVLIGLRGDDYLIGGDFFDLMLGGRGDDLLIGGSGGDIKAGGPGSDVYASPGFLGLLAPAPLEEEENWLDRLIPEDIIVDPGNPDDRDELNLFEFDEEFARLSFAFDLEAVRLDFDGDGSYDDLGILGEPLEHDIISIDQFKGDGSGLEQVRIGNGPGLEDDLVLMIRQGTEGTYENDALVGIDQSQGREYLTGKEGEDLLFGNDGRDVLRGGDGDDGLYGGRHNDVLVDGFGMDYMVGGKDNDLFVLIADVVATLPEQSATTWLDEIVPSNFDIVFDFNPDEDLIGLSGYQDAKGAPIDFDDLSFEDADFGHFSGTMVTMPAGPGDLTDMLFLNGVESTNLAEANFLWI